MILAQALGGRVQIKVCAANYLTYYMCADAECPNSLTQAVMAAMLGSEVSMITKVNPEDQFGQHMTAHFENIGLNTQHVLTCKDAPTGAATITVDREGKNCISVCMGANSLISVQDIEDARDTIENGA